MLAVFGASYLRRLLNALKQLTSNLAVSVAAGDLQFLENHWYVTHSGLLRIAQRRKCRGIETAIQDHLSDPQNNKWVIKATVFKSHDSKGFAGYGDADPSNVSSLCVAPSCASPKLAPSIALSARPTGSASVRSRSWARSRVRRDLPSVPSPSNGSHPSNGSGNGQPRLRDQLCLLIRQYNLDSNLVKAYAADFCGTEALSGASRELVESFISHLASAAKENRDALVCKLNSYAQPVEAQP